MYRSRGLGAGLPLEEKIRFPRGGAGIMRPVRISTRIRPAGAVFILAAAAGCSLIFPSPQPTPEPTAVPSPTPTPFSAQLFLHETGPDAGAFASRYFSTEGEFSLAVPVEWEFDQSADSGKEMDSVSEIPGGPAVAAFYAVKKLGKDKNPQQAMEAFYQQDWMDARHVDIAEQSEFSAADGTAGWKLTGTVIADPSQGIREACELIAFVRNDTVYVLAAYPDRSAKPADLVEKFEAAAISLRWEETRTRNIDKENTLQLAGEEPDTIDPALTENGAGGIVGDIFSGLVALDTSLNVRPSLAERWDMTPDGKTYTFHLKANARFQNGRPVTADDVLFSWLRAAGPELQSATAERYLGDIVGLREYHAGTVDSIPGIRVVDSRTIQVTLRAPVPFFLEKLTYPASWIVDRYNVRLPHWQFNPNGTGPFRMVQRVFQRSLLLEANSEYYDAPPKLQSIVYWITRTEESSLFTVGKVDRMTVGPSLLPAVNDPHDPMFGTAFAERKLCTNFIHFNTALPPFDDPLVRKAFSLSIDRNIYVEVTAEEGDIAGAGILPPGMTGYSPESAWAAFDPDQAKQLLAQSRYFNGTQPSPEILVALPSEAGEYDPTMEFLVDSWEKALGIHILVEGLPEEEYRERLKNQPAGQMIFAHHCADYPDPENFYNFLFHGENADLSYGYKNGSMDALLDSAAIEPDWIRRIGLYRQADQILYDDAPVLVLSYPGPSYAVWKTRVMGYVATPIDVPQHQFLWLVRE
jgi:oligopeptide transport system substrate-binding protein